MPTKTVPVAHIALAAADPLAVEQWYSDHFGFARTRVYDPGPDQVVMTGNGQLELEIFRAAGPRPGAAPTEAGPLYPGWRHLAFLVADLDATLAALGDDARVTLGPVDMHQYIPGMRVAWVADPAGNIVELNQGYVTEPAPPALADDLARLPTG